MKILNINSGHDDVCVYDNSYLADIIYSSI